MFEETVLKLIAPHLKDGDIAEFHNGTLFVTGSKDGIKNTYIALCNKYRKRHVKFTVITDKQYAFDFTK